MKIRLVLLAMVMTSALTAQSKKELEAVVAKLKLEIENLKKPKEIELTDQNMKASYGLGVLIAGNIKSQGADSLNIEALLQGFKDSYGNGSKKMAEEECMGIVQEYMMKIGAKKSERAKQEGNAFLEENKSKEGVKITASGLQYKIISSGNGKSPLATDKVTVHYTGKLPDGTIFDSSVQRGQPATFEVNGVIRGWTEALQLMHEGDKWILFIPSDLGYGERGAGQQIPPYATLIFEVELIKVN